jgi:sugar transferase EpsL
VRRVRLTPAPRWQRSTSLGTDRVKRVIDVTAAGVGLITLAPVMCGVAVAIRAVMGPPVLFRQVRVGLAGQPFTILKFRTMDLRDGRCCRAPLSCIGTQFAPGVHMSRLGSLLRRSGIDELPQLLNILRGDMSFIGPRPLLTRYMDRYTNSQLRRHDVRPGITGWAQVNGRTDLPWEDRLALDVWYVDHRSLRLDLRIACQTLAGVMAGAGFSQSGSYTGDEFLGSGVPPGICPVSGLPVQSPATTADADH